MKSVIDSVEYRPMKDIDQIATFAAKAAQALALDRNRELTDEEIARVVSEVKRHVFEYQDEQQAWIIATTH